MPPQMQRIPITCPLCRSPIVVIADSFTCPYCLISDITWTPIKSIDRTKFTQKEMDEKIEKEKEIRKNMKIEYEKKMREQKKKLIESQEQNTEK